jgi:hypothetical protein
MGAVPWRWLVAAAIGWLAAFWVYMITGQISLVLLAGPVVYVVGDVAAERRKKHLQETVDAAFLELVSDENDTAADAFAGRQARIERRRSRLLGLPPRLIDLRLVVMPDGARYAVRAETARADPAAISWRVTRLTQAEADAALAG